MQSSSRPLLALLLLLSACSASDAPDEPTSETLFGFQLAAFEGIPETEFAVRIRPAATREDLAQPASQLAADALRACEALARAEHVLDSPHTAGFQARGDVLAVDETQPPASALAACFLQSAAGKPLTGLGSGARQVTLQFRRLHEPK